MGYINNNDSPAQGVQRANHPRVYTNLYMIEKPIYKYSIIIIEILVRHNVALGL